MNRIGSQRRIGLKLGNKESAGASDGSLVASRSGSASPKIESSRSGHISLGETSSLDEKVAATDLCRRIGLLAMELAESIEATMSERQTKTGATTG